MKFSKNEVIVLNAIIALFIALITVWIVMNGFLISGIFFCVASFLPVILFNIRRTRRVSSPISISRSAKVKPTAPLSQAEKDRLRASEIDRLNSLLEKTKNEIAVEQAKGDYFSKLPELLKKKEQYSKELEELK